MNIYHVNQICQVLINQTATQQHKKLKKKSSRGQLQSSIIDQGPLYTINYTEAMKTKQ